jgi:hypothetical protein
MVDLGVYFYLQSTTLEISHSEYESVDPGSNPGTSALSILTTRPVQDDDPPLEHLLITRKQFGLFSCGSFLHAVLLDCHMWTSGEYDAC